MVVAPIAVVTGAAGVGTVAGLPAMSTMEIAVGSGEPVGFHVAYGVEGTWLHAMGEFGSMRVMTFGAARVAANAWFTIGLPILYPAAVLATNQTTASNCVTAAASALLQGWIP
jgi:hypothetical protein